MNGGFKIIPRRIEGSTWWREEVPNMQEINRALDNLTVNDNTVDYIFSHTAPKSIVQSLPYQFLNDYINDSTSIFLEHVYKNVSFKKMYCGHFHIDEEHDKCQFLFEKIVKI
jgi:hypothetical protein